MATFLPQQTASSSRPLPDFLPSSPPDQAIFNNLPQQTNSTQNGNGDSIHHRPSADFRSNGAAAYTNGNGAMPVPNGLPHQIPNGGSRHRGTMSLGAFDGPRSPPNTKSKAPYSYNKMAPRRRTKLLALQILHMFLANSSDQDSVKLGKLAPSPTRRMSQPSTRHVNTLPRYGGPNSRSSRPCTDSSAGQLQVRSKMRTGAHPSKWKKGQPAERTCWRAAQSRRQAGSSIVPAIGSCFGAFTPSSASERSSTTFWSSDPFVCGR